MFRIDIVGPGVQMSVSGNEALTPCVVIREIGFVSKRNWYRDGCRRACLNNNVRLVNIHASCPLGGCFYNSPSSPQKYLQRGGLLFCFTGLKSVEENTLLFFAGQRVELTFRMR